MNRISRLLNRASLPLACAFSLFAFPGVALAAGYLKFDGVDGESTKAESATRESEILSWSWGETSSTRTSGLATGKRQHKPFVITKPVDKASPQLQQASTSGRPIPAMELALPKEGGRAGELVKYKLKNVYVTSYSVRKTGTGTRATQTETFTLSYEESTAETATPAR
jgi:type VI secretion system secreted protein Hcp